MSWKDGKARLRFSPADDSVLEEVSNVFQNGCSLCARSVAHETCRLTKHASPEAVEKAKEKLRALVAGKAIFARKQKGSPWFPSRGALLDLLDEHKGSVREIAAATGIGERVVQRRVAELLLEDSESRVGRSRTQEAYRAPRKARAS